MPESAAYVLVSDSPALFLPETKHLKKVLPGYSTVSFEDDCACAATTSVDNMRKCYAANGLFLKTPNIYTDRLTENHHVLLSPFAYSGPAVLNDQAWVHWQSFSSPRLLQNDFDFLLAEMGLIVLDGQPIPLKQGHPQLLTAWLHITNACNLDCPYCYVRKSSERMDEVVGMKMLNRIFQTANERGFREIKLKYAGGEATLHFKLIRSLHARALELAGQTGIAIHGVVLSNGVALHPTDADWLVKNKVHLMISLDGVGEVHDLLRSQKGGGNTFAKVAKTIDKVLLPRGIKPSITMTVSSMNAYGAADLARWALLDRGLPVNFNLYRENTLSAFREELILEEETIIAGLKHAYTIIEQNLPSTDLFKGLLDRVRLDAHTHTCGVDQNYIVCTHKGQVLQCQMQLDQSSLTTSNDPLRLPLHPSPIQNLSVDEKEGCRDCTFRYRCAGGCPVETFRVTGRWDVKSPHCRIYKSLLPEMIRLEGLRMLKARGD